MAPEQDKGLYNSLLLKVIKIDNEKIMWASNKRDSKNKVLENSAILNVDKKIILHKSNRISS